MQNRGSSENEGLLLIKAAAGSGKTHRLTGEYLRLLFSGENRYSHILAVTFTNKATDEMKTRIIDELYNLSEGGKSDYLEDLMSRFALSETVARQRAKSILENILHDYSSFSISTIDKFFQQTMRAFTREMGLSGGYKLELDTNFILSQIIDLMISELDRRENKELAGWILDFMKSQIEDGKTWSIKESIAKLSIQLFIEKYKLLSREGGNGIDDKEKLKEYRQVLIKIVKAWENEVKAVAVRALEIMKRFGLAATDFKFGPNSTFRTFEKLANGDFSEPSGRFVNRADNLEDWSTKTSPILAEIEQAYFAGLNECVKSVIDSFNNNLQYNSAKSILQNFYTLGILSDVKKRLRLFQKENNTLFLSDTTELLNKIIADSDSPFVYEKTGTRIHNYMIDEFQDTSSLQWLNFRPLVGESLSNGNFNLVVGDVKQSIYRWRNSDWGLLENQISRDFGDDNIVEDVLDTNWRSDANIVKFNNQFFRTASRLLQGYFNSELKSDSDDSHKIMDAYRHVYQLIPDNKNESGGHVKISFLDTSDPETDWKIEVLEQLPLELENFQKQGFALKDIAILVRKNGEAIEIAEHLLKYKEGNPDSGYRYDIISNEALVIGNAQSVKAAVALLRYFQNRKDETRRLMAVYEYYRFLAGYTAEEAISTFFDNNEKDFPEELKKELEQIASLPFYEMVETFFSMNNHVFPENENVYVQAFLDIVLKFSTESSANTNDFLEWWDEKGSRKTLFSPDNQDAIRLMTVHKSKGLGFKVVIVPFLKWNIDHSGNNAPVLWCKPSVEPFDFIDFVPLVYRKMLANTIFKNEYFEEKLFTYIDNLNLLYVAFTRAKNRILGFSPKPRSKANPKNEGISISDVSELLWNTLLLADGEDRHVELHEHIRSEENSAVFEFGLPDPVLTKKKSDMTKQFHSGKWNSIPFDDRLKMRLNATGFFSDDGSRAFGTLMHEIISRIDTIPDIPNAVERKYATGELTDLEKSEVIDMLTDILSHPDVADWYSGKYKVLNETQVLLPDSSIARPDRVMIADNEVIVVDYKFGEVEEDKYERQVKYYTRVIREMGYPEVKGFLFYVNKRLKYEVE